MSWSIRCRRSLIAALTYAAVAELSACGEVVRSPDGAIEVEVALAMGAPEYAVRRSGVDVIAPSRLGFVLADGWPLTGYFEVASVERSAHDETWIQPWGEQKQIRSNYNELRIALVQTLESKRRMTIVFRVFDDGVAFRYVFPEQAALAELEIADEVTQFTFAQDARCWWIPAMNYLRYEYLYTASPISEIRRVHTPLTCETADGLCLSIHEASLVDYASMTLASTAPNRLEAALVPWADGIKARVQTPFATPWRTIQIADTPGELITSYMLLNLNEPNRLEDVSWIKPGKYVGVWWEMHLNRATWGSGAKHGATTENVKRFIDFAHQYGFDGVLVEGWNEGWDGDWFANGEKFQFTKPYPDFDLEGLAAYARERGVYLVGHHETAGGIANYERQMEDAYALYQRLGVRAVKTGYVANGQNILRHAPDGRVTREWHHGQFMVRHHQLAVEQAARRQIMLIAHEPIKDTGLRRTYPNMMSREAARGQEYNAWAPDGGNPPEHTTILPFTRMLSGPMDFTPGVFDLLLESGDRPDNRVNTTLAKQLALYVVLYAPLQMAVDFPEVYESHRDAFQFIVDVPTDWDETRVLHGKIGDYVVIARKERDADQWFLGAVTDEVGRSLETPLSFLDRDRVYVAEIYRDADDADWKENPAAYAVKNQEVDANTVLTLRLAAGGGQAIRFYPKDPQD